MKFNTNKFYECLDTIRKFQRLDWKDVAEQSGVDAAILTRMKSGSNPSADNLAALFYWSNLDFRDFFIQSKAEKIHE